MLLVFALVLTGFIYLGPVYIPTWFAWEKEFSRILPVDYELAKVMVTTLCLLVAFFYYRKSERRKERIFFSTKRDKGRLRLPEIKNNRRDICIFIFFFTLALCVLLGGYTQVMGGVTMVSVARDNVNMRSGPGTDYRVLWVLGKGCPLKVIDSRGNWYKVEDFEGDNGWIYKPLTSRKPHVVVKKKIVNIRSLPGTQKTIVAKAQKGAVFQTIGSVKGWLKVRHEQGVTGWVARRLVWGW